MKFTERVLGDAVHETNTEQITYLQLKMARKTLHPPEPI
jgi:hypothetical protein